MKQVIMRICCVILLLSPTFTMAQTGYPSRPVTMIVPAGAGGGLDAFARFIAAGISPALGQPVIVDNKPGANGAIGAQAVARAIPDGHTLLVGDVGVISINPALYPKLPYNPQKELTPVMVAARLPLMLVTGANSRFKSLDAFMQYAKTAKASFGSTGIGNISHLCGEMLAREAGIDMIHVPYKAAPSLLADVISGSLDVAVTSVVSGAELVKSGKLRALAVTGERRIAQLPDVPTLSEAGFRGFNVGSWISVHAPAGTAPETVTKLNQTLMHLLTSAEGRDWMARKGFDIVGTSPEEARSYSVAEQARWTQVIRQAKVEPN